jgi:hypothetical protein
MEFEIGETAQTDKVDLGGDRANLIGVINL